MKIKVIKSCNPENWYANMIGQIFETPKDPSFKEGMFVDYIDEEHSVCFIYHGDYEIWDDAAKIKELEIKVEFLQKQILELQSRPQYIPYPVYPIYPNPQPITPGYPNPYPWTPYVTWASSNAEVK
jgi:hypothetical protein